MTRPISGATFSPCPQCGARDACLHGWDLREYRYELWRDRAPSLFEHHKGEVLFCMNNPSDAEVERNDPTVCRCIGFRDALGFARMTVVNEHGWRSSHPSELAARYDLPEFDVVGPENDQVMLEAAARADMIIVAWGADPVAQRRQRAVLDLLRAYDLYCLKLTAEGAPSHPLARGKAWIPADAKPVLFRRAA